MRQKTTPFQIPKRDILRFTRVGSEFTYTTEIHPSVGYNVSVEWDESKIALSADISYDHPREMDMGMCGADSATKRFFFKVLKRGYSSIRIIHDFRGEVQKVINVRLFVL